MTTMELPTTLSSEPSKDLNMPTWFTDLQSQAWADYQTLPAPSAKDEAWRFGNRKHLKLDEFSPACEVASEAVDMHLNGLKQASAQFIFNNDDLIHAEADLPEGVICLPLQDALLQHGELVQSYFAKQKSTLGSAKFAALHLAHLQAGLFVYVPKGIKVEHPIECYHLLSVQKGAIFPHTLIITEELAEVTVVDYFKSGENGEGFCIAMNDLNAAAGSKLNYTAIQDLNLESKLLSISSLQTGRDARAKSFTLNLGAKWVRNESYARLLATGAHSDMLSINLPNGEQEVDQRTFQHHSAAQTYSDLLYKNTSYDKAKTVFSGLISVDEGAHFTDAYQTCRNLLMDDTAEANSMPGLQINADNVKCSHGSTCAAISDEEIFYLQARGIHAKTARQLIARGFSVEVVERLENEELEKLVLTYMDTKFKNIQASIK